MSLCHTIPIFPKWPNIGAVFLPTVGTKIQPFEVLLVVVSDLSLDESLRWHFLMRSTRFQHIVECSAMLAYVVCTYKLSVSNPCVICCQVAVPGHCHNMLASYDPPRHVAHSSTCMATLHMIATCLSLLSVSPTAHTWLHQSFNETLLSSLSGMPPSECSPLSWDCYSADV